MVKDIFALPPQLHVSAVMRVYNEESRRNPLRREFTVSLLRTVDSKPREAFWTSTYNPEIGSEWVYLCDGRWPHWLKHSDSEYGTFYKLSLSAPKRIAEIDSIQAAVDFTREFGSFYTSEYSQTTYCEGIRWYEVIGQYDAVHMAAAMPKDSVVFTRPDNVDIGWVDGWDIESTAWFSWAFNEPEIIEPNPNWFSPEHRVTRVNGGHKHV